MKKQNEINMCEGPIFKKMVAFAVPVILSNILQVFFGWADMIVVGQFSGSTALAAVGSATPLISLMVSLFSGLSSGGGVAVAQAIGAKNPEEISKTVHTSVGLGFLSGVVLSAVGVLFSGAFLRWMDTPGDVLPLAILYLRIYFVGVFFSLIYNFASAVLRATGDTKRPTFYLALAGVANIALNLVFVAWFKMGVAGVAWATTITQGFSAVAVLLILIRRTDAFKIRLSGMRLAADSVCKVVRIGLPMGVQSALFSMSNVLIQSAINGFGGAAASGVAASREVDGNINLIVFPFVMAAMNFAGQNLGAKKLDRVKQVLWISIACATGIAVVLSVIFILLGRPFLSVFITDSPEAMEYGMIRILSVVPFLFIHGIGESVGGVLRGLGCSFSTMIISLCCTCGFRILWIYTVFQIPACYNFWTLHFAYPISWVLTLVCVSILFARVYQKKKREFTV